MIEERLAIIAQWFDTWDEFNRIRCFEILLNKCSLNLLQYVKYEATKKLRNLPPTQVIDSRQDFTRNLPRYLCMRIYAYLDPRSLCRCAQVCWYWKYLADSEELWQTKCSKLGWTLADSNNWKQCYQQKLINIKNHALQRSPNENEPIIETPPDSVLDNVTDITNEFDRSSTKSGEKPLRKKSAGKEIVSSSKENNISFINRNRERNSRKPKEKKEPTVQPWRPSTTKPEDTCFNKFEKILKQRRSERRARSAAPGHRPSTLTSSKSPSSTNVSNLEEFSEWREGRDDSTKVRKSSTTVANRRKVQSVTEYKSDYANYGENDADDDYPKVEEVEDRKNDKQMSVYETTDALSTLKQSQHHVPWNNYDNGAFSDEEYD